MEHKNFTITNITCDACIKLSTMALKSLPGVSSVTIEQNGKGSITSSTPISNEMIEQVLVEVKKQVAFN